MKKIGDFICKYRKIILIIAILLLIPSVIGMIKTRVNYDILVYLPDDIETVEAQNILTNEFGIGGYSVIVLDNMNTKEISNLEEDIKKIDNVDLVLSVEDVLDDGFPLEMLPDEVRDKVYRENSTIMFATFKESLSSDETLNTIEQLRNMTDERVKVSGMSAVVLDTKNLSNEEVVMYVVIAVLLCIIVLEVALDSYIVPIILLGNIGIAILYNMGSNILLGEISYITKAISAVLQLGVTMDFAIFLYHSYMHEKETEENNEKAMSTAISKTMVSVVGSSITTIAGFLALCSMNLTLGKDIGIVMAKGVLLGVICVITVLPAMILELNNLIEKTKHKVILPKFTKIKNFAINHYVVTIVAFLIILPIAYNGYIKTDIYYNLDKSLPRDLQSIVANEDLKEKFNMVTTEIIMIDKNLPDAKTNEMLDKIEDLDGIEWTAGLSKLSDTGLPKEMIPDDVINKIENDQYELILVNSSYEMATDELNNQIDVINGIIKEYDQKAMLIGEGPLMKDLVVISNHDFNSVNTVSIGVIFILMIIVLKSFSLPFILIIVIEFAIFINMGIPYYSGTVLPFVASIVIGTIQLGATIDYAILITTKYVTNRKNGLTKKESVDNALSTSVQSIVTSGLCFFSATIGVGLYSKIEMISSLCVLMSRGAIISMLVVILVLPAFLQIFDKIICKLTIGMRKIKEGKRV